MNNLLPVFIKLENQPCLVVGGGKIAYSKVCQLLECKGNVTVIARKFDSIFDGMPVKKILRSYQNDDVRKFRLIIAATNNRLVNHGIYEDAKKFNIPVNVVDDPELCSFYMGAVHSEGELKIAISTNGKCPAFGSYLRNYLGEKSSHRWSKTLDRLSLKRKHIKNRIISFEKKKNAMAKLISIEEKRQNFKNRGKVFLVGAGPGDPELLTLKAERAIKSADVILYDALVNPTIVFDINPIAEKVFTGKRKGKHSIIQEEIHSLMKTHYDRGQNVVRLKGGDPFIFGRGGEESEFLAMQKIPFEIIPGITAGFGATAYSGIPLTMRHRADSTLFLTGYQCYGADKNDWSMISKLNSTLIIYMGLSRLEYIVSQLLVNGKNSDTPIAIIQNGTLKTQQTLISTLAEILSYIQQKKLETPALIVIGEVVHQHEKLQEFLQITSRNDFEFDTKYENEKFVENLGLRT